MRYVKWSEATKLVRDAQVASGLSVKDFGAKYGYTRPAMSNVVNGNARVSEALLEQLGLDLYVGVPAKSKTKR